jgi:arylsulfatase A-like enzyme
MSKRNDSSLPSTPTRRQFIRSSALGAMAVLAGSTRRAPSFAIQENRPPNILFINVDQLSHEAIGAHGCRFVQTPHIDRLAAQGATFDLSYSADPVCCPARSCWWTGRMSSETGVVENKAPMRKDLPDMGQWLRDAGYETVHAGKWHVPGRNVSNSFSVLFDGHPIGEHGDLATVRACEGFLRNRTRKDPFLLVAGLLNPHDICFWLRFNAGPGELPYAELRDELPPLPPNFQYDPTEPQVVVKERQYVEKLGAGGWSDAQWRYYIWAYYRYVEMVDGAVGRLLDALEDSALAENTIVIFGSDHGDGHGRHRLGLKRFLYDSAARVPLIVSAPGRLAEGARDTAHLVSGVDLAPTLCDFAGAPPPPLCRGRSLRPILEGRGVEWRDFVAAQSAVDGRMIRTPDCKYIAYKGDPVEQLFDMRNDPWETKNLAADPRFASTLEDHRRLLREWESTLDNAPLSPDLRAKPE